MILHEKYNQQLINVVIHVTQVLKKLIFQNLFVHLKLVLIMQHTMLLSYVWLFNSDEPYIKLPN